MKKLLAFLTFLLFLLLIWFGWNWYKTNVACCPETVVEVEHGPLYFDCKSDQPITSDAWAKEKSEIISAIAEGEKLLIVGPYFDGEDKSLGLTRAEKVESLFLDKLKAEDIELDSRYAGDCKEALSDPLNKTLFRSVIRNEHVVEFHDKAYIYFKYDTTKEIDTENVVLYLSNLIEELKATSEKVNLTGHTDADGTQEYNKELGMKRATRVKNYLVKNGIDEERITVESAGKLEPLSTNTTPEGKQKNRRVEIEVK
ncbi:MAG: OmpA family protein [Bacteroidota bacterium]